MKELISAMAARLRLGERVVLCSILESEGSTPRSAGAKMAVFADGSSLGTVGGGALERQAAEQALALLEAGRSGTKRYLLRPNRQEDIGMVCGGDTLLGFACLDRDNALALLEDLERGGSAWLKTRYFDNGTVSLRLLRREIHRDDAELPGKPVLSREADSFVLLEPVCSSPRVLIFGGGHVGAALVPALAAVDFSVTVYDERPEFADTARFPQAQEVLQGPFADISGAAIGPEDYVVVMTPGHLADFTVLCQALQTEACYIGCIGSRKKVAFVNEKLRQTGFSEEQIARIHAPIGLPILAQTPEEIAVSITAQLIYHRHGGR